MNIVVRLGIHKHMKTGNTETSCDVCVLACVVYFYVHVHVILWPSLA